MGPVVKSSRQFRAGERCQLSALGRARCPRYVSSVGTIVKAPENVQWVRVIFDGTRFPRTLHKSYLVHQRSKPASAATVQADEAQAPV